MTIFIDTRRSALLAEIDQQRVPLDLRMRVRFVVDQVAQHLRIPTPTVCWLDRRARDPGLMFHARLDEIWVRLADDLPTIVEVAAHETRHCRQLFELAAALGLPPGAKLPSTPAQADRFEREARDFGLAVRARIEQRELPIDPAWPRPAPMTPPSAAAPMTRSTASGPHDDHDDAAVPRRGTAGDVDDARPSIGERIWREKFGPRHRQMQASIAERRQSLPMARRYR